MRIGNKYWQTWLIRSEVCSLLISRIVSKIDQRFSNWFFSEVPSKESEWKLAAFNKPKKSLNCSLERTPLYTLSTLPIIFSILVHESAFVFDNGPISSDIIQKWESSYTPHFAFSSLQLNLWSNILNSAILSYRIDFASLTAEYGSSDLTLICRNLSDWRFCFKKRLQLVFDKMRAFKLFFEISSIIHSKSTLFSSMNLIFSFTLARLTLKMWKRVSLLESSIKSLFISFCLTKKCGIIN